jgi:hypothetical protein
MHSSSVRAGGCLLLAPDLGQPDGRRGGTASGALRSCPEDGGQALVADQVGSVDEAAQAYAIRPGAMAYG